MADKWQVNCALDTELVHKLDHIANEDRTAYNRTHLINTALWEYVDEWEAENGDIEVEGYE